MKKTLYDYKEQILKLPIKDRYSKEELLVPDFLIEKEGNVEVYYAPHNEYYNPDASVFIIGITPGFQQMSTAMVTARKQLELDLPIHEIQYACKVAGRFSGVIRKNIIDMLDQLKLYEYLGIESTQALFEQEDHFLYTVSLIPYSVFVQRKNYSGHTPKILSSDCLRRYVYENFVEEYKTLNSKEQVLLIPLGRAVEDVLLELAKEGVVKENQILKGFPHPSGANVNRVSQFREKKESMQEFLKELHQRNSLEN